MRRNRPRATSTHKLPARRTDRETPVSVRLDGALLEAIRTQAQRMNKPVSRVIQEMLETSLRMQRYPGIIFVEGPAGRRAHLAGTGLDVWEVIELLQEYESVPALREHFPRLSPMAIQITEAYAKAYPEEVSAFLAFNNRSPEQLKREFPWIEVVRS